MTVGLSNAAPCFLASVEKHSWHLPMHQSFVLTADLFLPLASQHGASGVEKKVPTSVRHVGNAAGDVEENSLLHAHRFN